MIHIPESWTPIAYEKGGTWHAFGGALFTVKEAIELRDDGFLLMAQKRCLPIPERPVMHMQIVVKRAKPAKARR